MVKQPSVFLKMIASYGFVSVCLLLYSYTQIDLNLTLSRAGIIQTIQKAFQHIGFYQRPLSTLIYLFLLSGLFILYSIMLKLAKSGKVTRSNVWMIIGMTTMVLVFSYPAFSYDFFNYMFTAKTVFLYHKNPYIVLPLQFAGFDVMLNFMRWTHLTSAYTPLWIILSVIPYIYGIGYFLIIMWNLKFVLAASMVLTAWCIEKIFILTDKKNALYGLIFFALNPLVLFEAVVSPHNDIIMMAFACIGMLLFQMRSYKLSYLFLALSVASKLMTILLYPVVFFMKWNKKWSFIAMTAAVIFGFWYKEILPWYFLWIIPFAAFLGDSAYIQPAVAALSGVLLLRYVSYIWFGDYSQEALGIRTGLTFAGCICVIGWMVARFLARRKLHRL